MSKYNFKRLEKWRSNLDVCIRCGYCYAHCPIFKSTKWESDAPRAKLIMIYGMLNGEIEPTEYISEKMLECFYCKTCETNCSSSLPITQILSDAQADLLEAGFAAKGTTSETNKGQCALCLECVRLCKHEARSYNGSIVVDRVKCQSCGACMDSCPRGGITMNRGFGTEKEYLRDEISAFLKDETRKNARAIVFSCNWSNYPGFQVSDYSGESADPEYKVLVTMCSGRLQSQLILDALREGAWGVLVTMCPVDKCEHDGNIRTKARISSFKKTIEKLGIAPERVKLEPVEKGNQKQMQDEIKKFMKEINELGPILKG